MNSLKDRCIRFDWAIKRLLRQKANFDVLEGFLTVFLNEKVKIMEILESEGNQVSADDKFNRVDIKAKNSKGEIIIVEVQNTSELYYLERILYGVAKAITEHIKLGNTYQEVKKVYSISILYFDLGRGSDYLYIGQNNFVGVHTKDHLVISTKEEGVIKPKYPAEIFPTYYLVRVNNFNEVAKSPLEEWMRYLKEGVINEKTTAPGLREAVPGMQRSLSAIPGALLCPVFASYPAKRGIFMTKTPPFCQWLFCLCKHKQCIIIHINKHSSKKHDGRMEPSGTITLNFLFSQPYI